MQTLIRVLALALAPALFGASPQAQAYFERAALEQMLAPIALYPDSVLSHVLIAATYPEHVEEAARWSRRHPDLEGEAAVDAVEAYDWDASVKALVAFPEILARMDEDPGWTDRLGEAFLEQEGDVMDSVQTLRDRAYDAGHLESLEHVRVIREREYIYIEPAVRHVVYIPYYDPWFVYGHWWWPSHPPHCWRTWRGHAVTYYPRGFHWGVGFHIEPTFYFTSVHWSARHVVVAQPRPNWRPIYSGRDVGTRHQEVRHWRQERHEHVRTERRHEGGARRGRSEERPAPRADAQRPEMRQRQERRSDEQERRSSPRERRAEHRASVQSREEQRIEARGRGDGEPRAAGAERRDKLRAGAREHRDERAGGRSESPGRRDAPRPERRGDEAESGRRAERSDRGRGADEGGARDSGKARSPEAGERRGQSSERHEAESRWQPRPEPRADSARAQRGEDVSGRSPGPERSGGRAERRERGGERPRGEGRQARER